MIESLEIKGFRGVAEGRLEGLGALTVLVGPNNSGKSTCLEALGTGVGSSNGDLAKVVSMLLRRGGKAHHALKVAARELSNKDAFYEVIYSNSGDCTAGLRLRSLMDPQLLDAALREGFSQPLLQVELAYRGDGSGLDVEAMYDAEGMHSTPSFSLLTHPRKDAFKWEFVDVEAIRASRALEDAYSAVELAGALPVVLTALQGSMPNLKDLRILKVDDEFILHLLVDDGPPVPAYLAGDGLKRLLAISAALSRATGGIALLEEPECFQHPRYLRELVSLLAQAVSSKTQIVMTTHSSDLIDLLLHHEPAIEGLVFERLRLSGGKLSATALDRETAGAMRDELLEDLRA